MNSGKLLLGVLAGVSAAAVLGVLFAPEKGSNTRKKMSKKGEHYADVIKGKFNEFLDEIAEKFEKVKEEVSGSMKLEKSKSAISDKEAKPVTE
jgi:gas vesicle protein